MNRSRVQYFGGEMKCGKDCAAYLLGIVVVAVVKNDKFNNNLFLTVQQHL